MAKSAKSAKRTNETRVMKAPGRTATVLSETSVNESAIARRAYDLYLARGRRHGHHVEDWLQAEQELRQSLAPSAV